MNADMAGSPDRSSLDLTSWEAFRYVSGEMSADEAAAFEERLLDEQPLREAVARAVWLVQAVQAAEPRESVAEAPRVGIGSRLRLRLATAAVLTACSLLALGLAIWSIGTGVGRPVGQSGLDGVAEQPGAGPSQSSPSETDGMQGPGSNAAGSLAAAGRLVELWTRSEPSRLRHLIEDPVAGGPLPEEEAPDALASLLALSAAEEAGEEGQDTGTDDEVFHVPGWLLAAVSADEAGADETAWPDRSREEN